MSFHEVQFPSDISKGSGGGPERRTDITTLRSGFEERNSIWKHSRRKYDASLGLRSIDELHEVLEFFEARSGRLYGFRWKDWADYRSGPPKRAIASTDQLVGVGDGSETDFQLVKRYSSGGIEYVRDIKKPSRPATDPDAPAPLVEVNSIAQTEGVDYTIDYNTGIITFTSAPTSGHNIRAGFWFDVPVRFDTDFMSISVEAFEAGAIPAIDIIEVRV